MTVSPLPPQAHRHSDDGEAAYLTAVGERVREMRARRGMTRKILARDSGVSERYLAQLEGGQGNISILLLRQLARALDTPIGALVLEGADPPVDFTHSVELLRRLTGADLQEACGLLTERFGGADTFTRRNRVALIGLRGAGKSTLGAGLAQRRGVRFIELDQEIERESGVPLAAIFDLYGQPGFRRLERRCLERVIEQERHAVIATGGSLVADAGTFERLLANCFTVWVRAAPATHMERVIAQGDMRPMSNNREAMADLLRILKVREPLYRRADAEIDTTGRSMEESLAMLAAVVEAGAQTP